MAKEDNRSIKMAQFKATREKTLQSYLQFTRPLHKLTEKEMILLTAILGVYYEEFGKFKNNSEVWEKVFDYENRVRIMDKVKMNYQVFNNYLTRLRKKKVIIHNEVNPTFNPLTSPDTKQFEIRFVFNIQDV